MTLYPRITRVQLQNWRSIERCDVVLEPLTLLVGPNGSGKSNFLDALGFMGEALRDSFRTALSRRGGVRNLLFRQGPEPKTHRFTITLEFALSPALTGVYRLDVGRFMSPFAQDTGSYIDRESLHLGDQELFSVRGKDLSSLLASAPPPSRDRLYLLTASGFPQVRPVYNFLAGLTVYHFDPETIREGRTVLEGDVLERRGRNLAAFLWQHRSPIGVDIPGPWSLPFLKAIVSDVGDEVVSESKANEALVGYDFGLTRHSDQSQFLSNQLSDGTLRLFAVLTALFQRPLGADDGSPTLVGLEEPELALHPAAMGPLLDAMRAATPLRQVLASTHSPDLLELARLEPGEETVLAVESVQGATVVGELDALSREAVREKLFNLGDLLRMRQLAPQSEP